MEYATLGRTGATVSRIGFGGATLGLTNYVERFDPYDARDRARMFDSIEAALEGGINFYDTAPGYGDGASERVLGEALAGVTESGGHPLFLATKVGFGSRGQVRESLEASLTRLRRDSIDLLQIHGGSYTAQQTDQILLGAGDRSGGDDDRDGGEGDRDGGEGDRDGGGGDPDSGGRDRGDASRDAVMESMLAEMQALRAEGLVRHIGFTTEDTNDSVYRLIRSGGFDSMQICYNLLYQHPYEPSRPFGSMLEAERQGMGILTMRTTTSGTFQRWVQQVNPGNTFDYAGALIQYVLSNPLVDVALVGMRDAEIVRANLALVDDVAGRLSLEALHERYV
jgi:aryl-alcohol dehydrogenase-like predicted oxidoreductase